MKMDSESFQDEVKAKRLASMGVDRDQVEALIEARATARAAKNWSRADEIRDELDGLKINVMDGANGVTWRVRL